MEKYLFLHLSRLGDTIQCLPAVKLLKKQKPGCQITYLGYEDFCALLRNLPEIDRLIELTWQYGDTFNDNNFDQTRLEKVIQEYPLLDEEYNYVINMTHNRTSSYLASKIKSKKVSGRIFSKNDEMVVSGKWAKYLVSITHLRKYNQLNLVDIYMGMAGLRNEPAYGYLPVKEDINVSNHLKELGYSTEKKSIGFQLGASDEKRMWPLENFVQLGKKLVNSNTQIIIFGSAKERTMAEEYAKMAEFPYIDLVGKTSLSSLPYYLNSLDVLVSNDTGTMHIASAIGKKVVGIFTAIAYHSTTGPYGAGHVALQSELLCSPCVNSTSCTNPICRNSITTEAVELGVQIALDSNYRIPDKDYAAGIYISSFSSNGTMIYKPLHFQANSFFSHLRRLDNIKAILNQSLWNSWLGIKNDDFLSNLSDNKACIEAIKEMQEICMYYQSKYKKAGELCHAIINEFSRKAPRLEKLNESVAKLKKIEDENKATTTPLRIIQNFHELYMSEVPVCNFPKLATYLANVYSNLSQLINTFRQDLQKTSNKLANETKVKA